MTEFVNLATLAIRGSYPIAGGTLEQSAWFINAMQTLESEINRIDAERYKRQYEQ